jgi:hypothetical protein
MKKEIIKKKAKEFKTHFSKTLEAALLAGFSFVVALTWRDLIKEAINTILPYTPIASRMIEALFITFVATMGIIIVSRIHKEENCIPLKNNN